MKTKHFNTPLEFLKFANKTAEMSKYSAYRRQTRSMLSITQNNSNEYEERYLEYKNRCGIVFKSAAFEAMAYNTFGDFVDVDRYLSGEPECMINFESESEKKATFQNIEIRYAAPGMSNDKNIKYYATVLSIIDELESNGTRCRVSIACDYLESGTQNRSNITILLKEYNEPLVLRDLCNLVLPNEMSQAARVGNVKLLGTSSCSGIDATEKMPTFEDRDGVNTLCFPSLWIVQNRFNGNLHPGDDYTKEFLIEFLGLTVEK